MRERGGGYGERGDQRRAQCPQPPPAPSDAVAVAVAVVVVVVTVVAVVVRAQVEQVLRADLGPAQRPAGVGGRRSRAAVALGVEPARAAELEAVELLLVADHLGVRVDRVALGDRALADVHDVDPAVEREARPRARLRERVRPGRGQRDDAVGVLGVPGDQPLVGGEAPVPGVHVEQTPVDGIREARAAGERVHRVGLEVHELAVRVVGEPVDPVHAVELGVRRVVEEAEPVLLRVEEVLDPGGAERRADHVRLLGVALPGVERAQRRVRRIAGRADHLVAEDAGQVDLRLPVGGSGDRVGHRRQPAGVGAGCLEAGVVEGGAELRRRDAPGSRRSRTRRTRSPCSRPTRGTRRRPRSLRAGRRSGRCPPRRPGTRGPPRLPMTDLSSRVIESRIANCWSPSRSRGTSRSPLCLSLS